MLADVRERHPDLRLVIIGGVADEYVLEKAGNKNYIKDLHELSARLGISDLVRWSGYTAPESDTASTLLSAADICVLPFDEGVSLNNSSFSFCAAHRLPIITTASETVESAFVDGENVILCAPKSASALANSLELLLANPHLQESLKSGTVQMVQEWFNWTSAIDRTMQVFAGTER